MVGTQITGPTIIEQIHIPSLDKLNEDLKVEIEEFDTPSRPSIPSTNVNTHQMNTIAIKSELKQPETQPVLDMKIG